MSKITQNAVLVLIANPLVQVFQDISQVVGADGKKTRVVNLTLANGTAVEAKDVQRLNIGDDAGSVIAFLNMFNALPAQPRSGYDKYVNDDGFVNPKSPEAFSPQGIGKTIAKALEVAYTIIGNGGSDAALMNDILTGLVDYMDAAPKLVAQRQRAVQLQQAIATLGAGTPEAQSLRAIAEKEGIALPPVVPAANVEATGDGDEADEDNADETEDATAEHATA